MSPFVAAPILRGNDNYQLHLAVLAMDLYEQFKNLLIMAAADGTLKEREIKLLADRCHEWGIGESDLAAAIENSLSDSAEFYFPANRVDRIEMLRDLIRMMAADGHLADHEKTLFAIAASKMEVGEEELNRIIDSVMGDRLS